MKNLITYIQESFKLRDDNFKIGDEKQRYNYFPKDKDELKKILRKRLKEDLNADLNDIDTSEITDMSYLFSSLPSSLYPHNIDISKWDVSKVINMTSMFNDCCDFNSDLSNWNISRVRWVTLMFYGCKNFEGKGLENWDVSNIKSMKYMFEYCEAMKNKPSWYEKYR